MDVDLTPDNITFHNGPHNFGGIGITSISPLICICCAVLLLEKVIFILFKWSKYKLVVLLVSLSLSLFVGQQRSFLKRVLDHNGNQGSVGFYTIVPMVILKMTPKMDEFLFKKCLFQIMVLGSVGMALFGFLVGYTTYLFDVRQEADMWLHILVYGVSFSSIDDVEISHTFLEYEAIRDALVILDGEYILTTSFSAIGVNIIFGIVDGSVSEWYQILAIFVRYILLGIIVGSAMGWIFNHLVLYVQDDIIPLTTSLVLFVYGTFMICELTLHCSGIVATFIFSICTLKIRKRLPMKVADCIQLVVDTIYFFLMSSTFILAIFIETERITSYINLKYVVHFIATFCTCFFSRLLVILLLYPVLKYLGRNLKFNSIFVIFWLPKRGVVQLILMDWLFSSKEIFTVLNTLSGHIVFTITIGLIVNTIFTKHVLHGFDLTSTLINKQFNQIKCVSLLNELKDRVTITFKASRLYTGIIWNQLISSTNLYNPYEYIVEAEIRSNLPTFCDECKQEIIYKPVGKKYQELIRDCKLKLFKAEKVIILRLLNKNLINKNTAWFILRGLRATKESSEIIMNIDELLNLFKRSTLLEKLLELLVKITRSETTLKPPRKKFRRICYKIIKFGGYHLLLYLITLSYNVIFIVRTCKITLYYNATIEVIYTVAFLLDFFLKIMGHSHIYVRKGFALYFSNMWNVFDFIILFNNICVTIISFLLEYNVVNAYAHAEGCFLVFMVVKQMCLLRILKTIVILYHLRHYFLKLLYKRVGKRVSFSYDVANALIMCHSDIVHMLPAMEINPDVYDYLMQLLEAERVRLQEEIWYMNMAFPLVISTHHTELVSHGTMSFLQASISRLTISGLIDKVEAKILSDECEEMNRQASQIALSKSLSVPETLKNVLWLQEAQVYDMALKAAVVLAWKENDVVVTAGQILRGVIILTEGMFLSHYKSTAKAFEELRKYGILPITDYHLFKDMANKETICLIPGSHVGLLAVLTGRRNDAHVIAKVNSKGIFIPEMFFLELAKKGGDPINGLYSVLWKTAAFNIAHQLLWETRNYRRNTRQQIFAYMYRSVVPYLCDRKTFVVKEFVEDVVLIEGLVEDMESKTTYVGPVYIPRGVNYLRLLREKNMAEPILWIVPTRSYVAPKILQYDDFEPYEILNIDEDEKNPYLQKIRKRSTM